MLIRATPSGDRCNYWRPAGICIYNCARLDYIFWHEKHSTYFTLPMLLATSQSYALLQIFKRTMFTKRYFTNIERWHIFYWQEYNLKIFIKIIYIAVHTALFLLQIFIYLYQIDWYISHSRREDCISITIFSLVSIIPIILEMIKTISIIHKTNITAS